MSFSRGGEYCLTKLDPDPDPKLKWGLADEGAKRMSGGGGGGEGGSPFPHQELFTFWGFKISDLVHTLGEFVRILSVQKLIGK